MTPPPTAVDDDPEATATPATATSDIELGPDAGASGPGDGDAAPPGEEVGPGGLSWGRVLILSAALTFLGFAIGVFVSRDTAPGDASVDVGFYRDMVTHHQQAQSLARLELAYGENATIRSFASDVLTFQSYEVGVMQRTLAQWGASGRQPDEAMAWMDMAGPVEQMPGWVTDEEMARLADARGSEADSLFLDLMAGHHAGGLHMATYAAEHAADQHVRHLAALMAYNQALEINEYRDLASRLGYAITIDPVVVPPAPSR